MNAKKRKGVKTQLEAMSKAQLVALAVQKTSLTYQEALATDKDALVMTLVIVEGVLKPVQA